MLTRLHMLWVRVRDSLWFIPAVLTLVTSALAIVLVRLESAGAIGMGDSRHWLVASGAEGARGVLSTIAGGLITVTGVVFSVTIVALQLASSQFTPRLLRNFTADRSNQLVLGIFIATFTYTLLVLRTIESEADDRASFVPRIAVAVSLLLVLVSIASLIYFINHAARSIQVSVILDRVTRMTLHHIDTLFPLEFEGDVATEETDGPRDTADLLPIVAEDSGYLQAVDAEALFEVGARAEVAIRMERYIGDFVIEGQVVAWVEPCDPLDQETLAEIRDAFVLGAERTFEQDIEFGIIEISDIAVKALSPGINDPTTALTCIDRLGQILRTFGSRRAKPPLQGKEGRVHFTPRFTTFERAVDLAFGQIRHFGSGNPTVARKILDVLGSLEGLLPEPRRGPLRHQALLVRSTASRSDLHELDLASLDRVVRHPRPGSREEIGA